jgi:HEAT repeat protein
MICRSGLSRAVGLLAAALLVSACADLASLGEPERLTPREEAARAIRTLETSRDQEARVSAASTLKRLRAPESVPILLAALRDPDADVRGHAADALGGMPDAAAQSVPALRQALATESFGFVRNDLAWALKTLKAEPGTWVPALRANLRDPDPLNRYNAALGLAGQVEPAELLPVVFAEIGTPAGRQFSKHPASFVGDLVKSNDVRLIPLLVAGLGSAIPEQRRVAARELGRFRPVPSARVRDPLLRVLRDPDAEVREYAVRSLMQVGYAEGQRQGPLVGPALAEMLRDPSPAVRRAAAGSFRSMEAAPRSTMAPLIASLRDPDAEVRGDAAFGLMGYLPPATEAVPAMVAALGQETDKTVRVALIRSLGHVGSGARAAVPALRTAVRDPDGDIRDAAAAALSLIEPR